MTARQRHYTIVTIHVRRRAVPIAMRGFNDVTGARHLPESEREGGRECECVSV